VIDRAVFRRTAGVRSRCRGRPDRPLAVQYGREFWLRIGFIRGLLELCASILSLRAGAHAHWKIPAGFPFLAYGFRSDALSSYFILILSLLAVTISIYSLGIYAPFEEKKTVGLLRLLLQRAAGRASLRSSRLRIAFFFLIAWEAMALSSYCLVSFHHREESTRSAGSFTSSCRNGRHRVPCWRGCSVVKRGGVGKPRVFRLVWASL